MPKAGPQLLSILTRGCQDCRVFCSCPVMVIQPRHNMAYLAANSPRRFIDTSIQVVLSYRSIRRSPRWENSNNLEFALHVQKGKGPFLSCCRLVWQARGNKPIRPWFSMFLCENIHWGREQGGFGGGRGGRGWDFSALAPSQLTPLELDHWLRAELSISQDPFSSILIHLIISPTARGKGFAWGIKFPMPSGARPQGSQGDPEATMPMATHIHPLKKPTQVFARAKFQRIALQNLKIRILIMKEAFILSQHQRMWWKAAAAVPMPEFRHCNIRAEACSSLQRVGSRWGHRCGDRGRLWTCVSHQSPLLCLSPAGTWGTSGPCANKDGFRCFCGHANPFPYHWLCRAARGCLQQLR